MLTSVERCSEKPIGNKVLLEQYLAPYFPDICDATRNKLDYKIKLPNRVRVPIRRRQASPR